MDVETTVLFLLFRTNVSAAEIEKILRGLGEDFPWAKVFRENDSLHGLLVPAARAVAWRDTLARLPEVAWVECVRDLRLVPGHAA